MPFTVDETNFAARGAGIDSHGVESIETVVVAAAEGADVCGSDVNGTVVFVARGEVLRIMRVIPRAFDCLFRLSVIIASVDKKSRFQEAMAKQRSQ
jgi:hypothetical protein